MGFKFRYEALLSYRGHIKEKAEIELSKAQQRLKDERDLLNQYQISLQQGKETFEKELQSGISSGEVKGHADYRSGLEDRIGDQGQRVVDCEKSVKEKIDELLIKTRDYKIIEKLKEKDFQKWKHQQLQIERKTMNEVAVTRHGRVFF